MIKHLMGSMWLLTRTLHRYRHLPESTTTTDAADSSGKSPLASRFHSRWWDLLSIAVLVTANPVLYALGKTSGKYPPDSIKYMMLGADMLPSLQLSISGIGIENAGLILPPLYPFLIALGATASGNPWFVAGWINSACLLLAAFPLFFLLRPITGRMVAVAAVLVIQLNYYYFLNAFIPLTEALFILVLALSLWLLRHSEALACAGRWFLLVGVSGCLLFFSRHIGIFFVVFALLWLWTAPSCPGRTRVATAVTRALWLGSGFLLLFIPYTYMLYQQTGQTPFQQHYRLSAPAVITDPQAVSVLRDLQGRVQPDDYEELLSQRRQLYRLTPDNSAMYTQVVTEAGPRQAGTLMSALSALLSSPGAYFSRLFANLVILYHGIGPGFFWLYLASMLTPFLMRSARVTVRDRLLLGSVALFYLLCISVFTGVIQRYVLVMLPFVLIQLATESFVVSERLTSVVMGERGRAAAAVLLAVLAIGGAGALMPRTYSDLALAPQSAEQVQKFSRFKKIMGAGAPVLSTTPVYSFLAGGSWRILPNDRLDRVVSYAHKNGIRWLIVRNPEDSGEARLYDRASWYSDPALVRTGYKYLRMRSFLVDSAKRGFVLFQIR